MEQSLKNVEEMFDKAEAEVKYLTMQFESKLDADASSSGKQNPLHLVKEIESVKMTVTSLKEEIASIESTKQETVDCIRGQLTAMAELMQRLEAKSGIEDPEAMEASMGMFEELAQALGVPASTLMPPSTSHGGATDTSPAATASK